MQILIRSSNSIPRLPWPNLNRGQAHENKAHLDRAIADFNKAIEINSQSSWGYFYRGVAYQKKNDKERAITDLRKAWIINPANEDYKKALLDLGEKP